MISKYTYKGLTWIDLESPTEDELSHIMEGYSIPAIVGEEMKHETLQSKVDLYPNFIYLILHFPELSHKGNRSVEKEIDFIVSKEFIITTHYEPIDSLHEFSKTFEVDAILEKRMDVDHGGFLFFHIIKSLYVNSRRQLDGVNLLLKDIEQKIFEGTEGKMVATISNINRTLLDFRQAIRFHKETLNSFELSAKHFFGEKFGFYISAIISEYNKTQANLDSHKEILDDLRDTNDSLLANKTTETIKILTIITFLISPITVISNIFVINSKFLRSEDMTLYFLVLILMMCTSLLAFIYIKNKKWF
ncbi:MAG: CorA family divalent cation transporter [Candidatus Woesearchaeota archaeon]|jgi:magnesium transporter